jgi:hypothetical protein
MRLQFPYSSSGSNSGSVTPTMPPTPIDPATTTAMHGVLGAVRVRVRELGEDPDGQVAGTVGVMRERVQEDVRNPQFQAWARGICGSGDGGTGDDLLIVDNAYTHVKGVIRFERDEVNAARISGGGVDPDDVVEVIIRPVDMMEYVKDGKSVGDCDDFSMYLAALLEACGVPCSFVTVAADREAPYQFSHVYVAAYPMVDGGTGGGSGERVRIPLDASHGDGPGWEAEQVVTVRRKKEWKVSGCIGSLLEVAGVAVVVGALWWMTREASRV